MHSEEFSRLLHPVMSSVHQILPPGSLFAVWTSHVSLRVVHSCDQGRLLPTLSPTMGSLQTRTEDTTNEVGLTELIMLQIQRWSSNGSNSLIPTKNTIQKKTTKLSISFYIKHLWDPLFADVIVFFWGSEISALCSFQPFWWSESMIFEAPTVVCLPPPLLGLKSYIHYGSNITAWSRHCLYSNQMRLENKIKQAQQLCDSIILHGVCIKAHTHNSMDVTPSDFAAAHQNFALEKYW